MDLSPQKEARGGVLLLGSLFWEGQKRGDGKNGEERKRWRKSHLNMRQTISVKKIPLRYGRKSKGRNGQFTMILRPYQKRGGGEAKMAPFKESFEISANGVLTDAATEAFRIAVEALARVEGIWTKENASHVATDDKDEKGKILAGRPWGLVAIWINPDTRAGRVLQAHWRTNFRLPNAVRTKAFGNLIDRNGVITLPWPSSDLGKLDFCLCTPTRPNVKNWSYAAAVLAINRGDYFDRTRAVGIITADDSSLCKNRKRYHQGKKAS